MNGVLAITRASVTEHFRRRLILFFLAMLVLVTAGLIYLNVNEELASTVTNAAIGLAITASLGLLPLLATLAALAVSMNNIGRPFADGEAALVLYRPITRWQYALGRLAGSFVVIFGICAVSAGLMQLVGLLEDPAPGSALWGHWASTVLNLTVLASITTLASSLVNAPVLAALISYFLYSISGFVEVLYQLVSNNRVGGAGAAVITAAWYLTPKRLVSPLLMQELPSARSLADLPGSTVLSSTGRTVWAIAYLAVMVLLTFLVVERKDLQG